MEPPPRPQTPRAGKYCPRCHAMSARDQAVCAQCGHRFRTGTDSPAVAGNPALEASAGPDPMNRTMQFTLPPLPPRTAAPAAPAPVSIPSANAFPVSAPSSRRSLAAGLTALLLCLGAALIWHACRGLIPPASTPAGVWETTLHGRASANAHLEFALNADGTGRFSWRESAPAALSGQTPLHWQLSADRRLTLSLTPPADGDPVSQTLAGIFSRHSWPWRVDSSPRRLVLGTLVFTEKP